MAIHAAKAMPIHITTKKCSALKASVEKTRLQIINPIGEKRLRGRSNSNNRTVINGIAPVLPKLKNTGIKIPL